MRITGKDANEIFEKYINLNESGCVANMGVGSPSVVVVDAPGSNAAGGAGVPKGRYPGQISNVNASGAQNSAYENNEEEADSEEQNSMAQTQMLVAAERAIEVFEYLHKGGDIEAWAASKLTLAADYIQTVANYLKYKDQSSEQNNQIMVVPLEMEGVVSEKKVKQRLDPKCWKGYRKAGTKVKGDTRVNKCIKVKK